MTATTATDDSDVEYFFECLTLGGHDSGWQDNSTYTDTGLDNDTSYTYQVKARDKSVNHNETAPSLQESATTFVYSCTEPIDSDFDYNCKVDFLDFAILGSLWIDTEEDSIVDDLELLAEQWLLCNRDPNSECWW